MTVQDFVTEVLCVPVSKEGNRLIVEAIEIVLDNHTHRFYPKLTEITGKETRKLEEPIRVAKLKGWELMAPQVKKRIFFTEASAPTNTQYIVYAAGYYRRNCV